MSISLVAKLRADGSEFQNDVKRTMAGASRNIGAYLSVGAAAYALRSLTAEMTRIKDMSEQLQMNVETFQQYEFALKQAGLSGESLQTALQKIATLRDAALSGDVKAGGVFAELSIDAGRLRAMNADELLRAVAAGLSQYGDAMRKSALASDLFGRSGPRLISTLRDIEALTQKARDEGLIFTERDIERFDEVDKKLANIVRRVKSIAAAGVVNLVEGIKAPGTAVGSVESQMFNTAADARGSGAAVVGMFIRRVRQATEAVTPDVLEKFQPQLHIARALERALGYSPEEEQRIKAGEEAEAAAQKKARAAELSGSSTPWMSTLEDYQKQLREKNERTREIIERRSADLTANQQIGAHVSRAIERDDSGAQLRSLVLTNQQILQMLKTLGSPAWAGV